MASFEEIKNVGVIGAGTMGRGIVMNFVNAGYPVTWLDVNGERQQSASTAGMIFKVPYLISYISRFMRLEPGDVILTGTPGGVGLSYDPPRFLKAGDRITVGGTGLGSQSSLCVAV